MWLISLLIWSKFKVIFTKILSSKITLSCEANDKLVNLGISYDFIFLLLINTFPLFGLNIPDIMFNRELFPLPLGP